MTLSRSSLCALHAAFEMALAGGDPVTVAGLARRHGMSAAALAKVLQQLVRAGIAVGARGVGGGYWLARPASAISVLDVIRVFERPRVPGQGVLGPRAAAAAPTPAAATLQELFDEVDELVRSTYASVSLETLVRTAKST